MQPGTPRGQESDVQTSRGPTRSAGPGKWTSNWTRIGPKQRANRGAASWRRRQTSRRVFQMDMESGRTRRRPRLIELDRAEFGLTENAMAPGCWGSPADPVGLVDHLGEGLPRSAGVCRKAPRSAVAPPLLTRYSGLIRTLFCPCSELVPALFPAYLRQVRTLFRWGRRA